MVWLLLSLLWRAAVAPTADTKPGAVARNNACFDTSVAAINSASLSTDSIRATGDIPNYRRPDSDDLRMLRFTSILTPNANCTWYSRDSLVPHTPSNFLEMDASALASTSPAVIVHWALCTSTGISSVDVVLLPGSPHKCKYSINRSKWITFQRNSGKPRCARDSSGLKINHRKWKRLESFAFGRWILGTCTRTCVTWVPFSKPYDWIRCIRFSREKSIQIGHLPVSRQFTTPLTPTCSKLDRIKIRATFSEGVNIFMFFSFFFVSLWGSLIRRCAIDC